MIATVAAESAQTRRWARLLAPPAIWAAHLTFVFLATVALCPRAETAARIAVLVAGAVATGSIGALSGVSLAAWARLRRHNPEAIEGREPDHYFELLAVFTGLTSLLGVLLLFVPGFTFTPACGVWR
jgi:hypothetical protein